MDLDAHFYADPSFLVRAVLGLLVIFAWRRFRQQLEINFGQSVTIWFTLITASQFHFMYYLSRPLPNTFALVSGNIVIISVLLTVFSKGKLH